MSSPRRNWLAAEGVPLARRSDVDPSPHPPPEGPRPGRIIDELSRDRLQAHLLEGVRFVCSCPTEQRGQLRILQGTFTAGPDERGQSKPALHGANPVRVG